MFEKKIKNFFDSVSICGEKPKKEIKMDRRLFIIIGMTAGALSAALGAGLALYFTTERTASM